MDKKPQDIMFTAHPITLPSTVMPRKSRWTLTNVNHPNILWWIKSLKTDYVNRKIDIEIYDDAKGDVFNWMQDLLTNPKSHSPLVLTHFDNSGETNVFLEFVDLKIIEHSTDYSYDTNSILCHKMVVSYQKINRQNS